MQAGPSEIYSYILLFHLNLLVRWSFTFDPHAKIELPREKSEREIFFSMFTRKPGRARYEFLFLFTRQTALTQSSAQRRCTREQKKCWWIFYTRSTNVIGKEERSGCHQPVQVEIEENISMHKLWTRATISQRVSILHPYLEYIHIFVKKANMDNFFDTSNFCCDLQAILNYLFLLLPCCDFYEEHRQI